MMEASRRRIVKVAKEAYMREVGIANPFPEKLVENALKSTKEDGDTLAE